MKNVQQGYTMIELRYAVAGIGTLAGGAISAATATAITIALGEAYIAVLAEILSENPDAVPTAGEIGEKLKEKMKKAGA